MPRFTEDQLSKMCRPASDTEETKLQNAESMLRKALSNSTIIQSSCYDIFGQGSYANSTNIRQNSDIDINVCYTNAFYYEIPKDKIKSDYGFNNPVDYSFQKYKDDIEKMLVAYYGCSEVIRNNKCITVKGNTNRIEIDVVPTWKHRDYNYTNMEYAEGVVLWPDNQNEKIINYPKQHIANGKTKNSQVLKRFKRLTRIFKNICIKMKDDNYHSNENISSFLLECLAYNTPNAIYVKNEYNCVWNNILRDAIFYLWNSTKENSNIYNDWCEVSNLLYLMRGHKWSRQDVNSYMYHMWNYLELE